MNQQQAQAFLNYIQRCMGIVPTTLTEAATFDPCLQALQAIAAGQSTCELKPVSKS